MRVDFDQIKANIRDGAYKSIGSGSGRRVFDLDNGYVVKVAKNKKGLAQNEAEYQISSKSNSVLFAKILQVSEDYHMLIMQKAEVIKHISEVWGYFNVESNRGLYYVEEIRQISSEYNLLMADLYRPVNWGRINSKLVIIDFGFTRRVRKRYY